MKWKILLVMVVVASNCFCDQYRERVRGNGNLVKQERAIKGVTGIKTTTFVNVEIKLGKEEKLVMEAEENLQQYILTEVEGGMLIIKTKPYTRIRARRKTTAFVTVTSLDTLISTSSGNITAPSLAAEEFLIRLSSSGDLRMENLKAKKSTIRLSSSGNARMANLAADTVQLSVTSSGDIRLADVQAEDLEVSVSSSGNISISGGKVKTQNVRLSSSGNYQAGSLASEQATVRTSSSGSAYIQVSEYLKATTTSSGSINYSGSPRLESRRTSSGKIRQR